MNTRDQFGNYLLLKKLGEDALGETFRAGRVGRQTLDRVVLLRVVNGQGFDGERITRTIQARSGIGQALKSPNIGQAIEVGQVRGVPYVIYDYASGRSLAQLHEQAGRRSTPMPLDHALLVTERIALALAVANETKIGDERVQHGFLIPHLIQVSNEGELKLLGFEASSGLRESATHPLVRQAFGRYLAPETMAGQAASRSDDVYSLGALLYEMATGQLVPLLPPTGLASILDQAVVAAEGTHLPAEIGTLLKRTLCPREQRVPDVVAWHKALSKLMSDSGYAATTFNLAFFLHGLFRDEIERETREVETEKSQAAAMVATTDPIPVAALAAARAAAPSPVQSSGPVRDDTNVLAAEYGLTERSTGKKGMLLAAGVGAAAVLGVVGYLLFGRGGSESAQPPAGPASAASPAAATPSATGMTPEQVQALIDQALANQRQQIDSSSKAQADDEIKKLQRQLEEAKGRGAVKVPVPVPASVTPANVSALTAARPEIAEVTSPNPRPASSPAPSDPTPTASDPAPAAQPPGSVLPTPQPIAAAPAPSTAGSATPNLGDLVVNGPGVTSPRIVKKGSFQYPPAAQRLRKEATVTVRALVDENGRATEVQLVGNKVGFGLDEAAMAYARTSQWEPAKKNGVRVKIWWNLTVAFKL